MLTGDEELDAILLGEAPAELETKTDTAIDRPAAQPDALPATPATAAGAASPPAPVDALDVWLDDDLGEVEELSFSLDGSGPTSSPLADNDLDSPDRARDSVSFADEPTTLHASGAVARRVHEEATAVLPRVREEPLPPLPIDGDAIPVLAGDERATAMVLPPRDAELDADFDFAQAIDDFSEDPRVQIVTRPGPARAAGGRDFDPSEMVTQVPTTPGVTDDLLDGALGELDLDDALEIDDIEIVEAESQPHAAPPAERLAAGTPPYPPASPQPGPRPESNRPLTPVSSAGLPPSTQRRPLPGLPPEPGQSTPAPSFPPQAAYPPAAPGYPAHPHAQPGPPPYPPDAPTPPPVPQGAQPPVYPVADGQPRPDDDDDGKKRGFFGRIFKK